MAINTTNKTYHLLIDAMRAVGMGFGIYLTKPTLEKRLSKSFNLVETSVNKTLKHAPERKLSNPISFELAGLGGIAAYKIYKGFKEKKKANVVEGLFLTTVMAAALVYTISLATRKSANR